MNLEELEQIAESVRAENAKFDHEINVCMGTGCLSQHSDRLKDALAAEVTASGKQALVRRTGCMGLCAAGPLVLIDPEEVLYQQCKADNAKEIVASLGGQPVAALQCDLREHFDQQVHVVLENSGHIDPERIEDYIAHDGYLALVKVLADLEPNDVIKEITESGLRGRGGGGYPTGLKWGTVAKAVGDIK
jgi:bidirectional [NiFe] hydrogenase diaphorase subunit